MNVFLSYISSDREIAERLAPSLRDEGHSVSVDRAFITPGEDYDSHIRRAVEKCNLFIFLISPESVTEGSSALTELGIAQHRWDNPSGRILPVMVSEVDLDTLPPYLKAVTVLRPQVDLVAEVVAAVSRVHRQRKRVRIYWALVLFVPLLSFGAVLPLWFRWGNEWSGTQPRSPAVRKVAPVQVFSSLSNSGWMLNLDILADEPIKEIFYQFADEDSFKSTGLAQERDPRTGLARPRSYMEVPLFKGTRTLLVKYTDSSGREHGPYTLILDAVKLIVAETKNVLEMTKMSWVAFREYPTGRMNVYFSHLLSYKNGLKEIQFCVDNEPLSRLVRFTPDWSGPGAPGIGDDDEIVVQIPMSAKSLDVKLVFIDGSEWPTRRFAVPADR
jgi:hypothetical protein